MSSYDEAREAAYGAWVRALVNDEPINYVPILNDAQKLRIDAAIDAFLGALSADSEMVERVAKAIHSARQSRGFSGSAAWEYEPANILELYRATARAAIAAMLTTAPAPASQQATPAK